MSKMYRWDTKKNIVIPGEKTATIEFCAKHFIYCAENAIQNHGKFFVALSGGSTPRGIYDFLATHCLHAINWGCVYAFWSDERSVPPNHPDSNYHMAMSSGFGKLPIPKSHVFRMQAETHIKEQAKAYEQTIAKVLHGQPFDLIMLGMGEDGHTASLFPNTEGLTEKYRDVIANYIPQKECWRMTLTFKCINRASNIAIYVIGDSKKQTLREVFEAKDTSSFRPPCIQVGSEEHPALWIVDKAASSLVTPLLEDGIQKEYSSEREPIW